MVLKCGEGVIDMKPGTRNDNEAVGSLFAVDILYQAIELLSNQVFHVKSASFVEKVVTIFVKPWHLPVYIHTLARCRDTRCIPQNGYTSMSLQLTYDGQLTVYLEVPQC